MSLADTPSGNVVQGEAAYLGNDGNPSSVGPQIRVDHYYKKALIEIRNKQYFQPLANVRAMPKNMGKTIKQFKYIPLLDDRNLNDQGIDAAGATILATNFYIQYPAVVLGVANASKAAAVTAIEDNVGATLTAVAGADDSWATGYATITLTGPLNAKYLSSTEADAVMAFDMGQTMTQGSGNLYGSSKDIGLITSKIPALTEHGGRVNRIGHTRIVIEGSIVKQGFFSEYTQESLDFDTDSELMMHITEESLVAANEMTEDNIQRDLLNGAGIVRYAGDATANAEITAEGAGADILGYEDLLRLSIDLDNNKCPKSTKIITGSRMIDTRVINAARYLYCGSEMIPTFERMTDLHSAPAFRSVETYAQAGNVVNGEIGSVGKFRVIVVPEMMRWAGAGAAVGTNPGYMETAGFYDVIPCLVVGSGSFTTIGFQTDGKTVKFKIIHKKPGVETATAMDPYGEKGHYAIKWYYGMMLIRPEWISVIKCVGEM